MDSLPIQVGLWRLRLEELNSPDLYCIGACSVIQKNIETKSEAVEYYSQCCCEFYGV